MTKRLTIGIQGGPGSFNEEACRTYCQPHGIHAFKIRYLYTTHNVLKALHDKKIDRGIFAIQNSIGGMVKETINALSRYNCKIIDDFQIEVNHCLLAKPGVPLTEIDTVLSHPQALAQCQKNIGKKLAGKRITQGDGLLVDQATAARALARGKLPETTAVIASGVCAELYPLTILLRGLQDKKPNLTTFLFVGRFDGTRNGDLRTMA